MNRLFLSFLVVLTGAGLCVNVRNDFKTSAAARAQSSTLAPNLCAGPKQNIYDFYAMRLGISELSALSSARLTLEEWKKLEGARILTHEETLRWLGNLPSAAAGHALKVMVDDNVMVILDREETTALANMGLVRRALINGTSCCVMTKPNNNMQTVHGLFLEACAIMADSGENISKADIMTLLSPHRIVETDVPLTVNEELIGYYRDELARIRQSGHEAEYAVVNEQYEYLCRNPGKTIFFPGFRIQHNVARGPAKGGLRAEGRPSGSMGEVYMLASLMSLKNSAAGLPYGGGKGGVVMISSDGQRFDPRIIPPQAKALIFRGFVRGTRTRPGIAEAIGALRDVPAGDMNTDGAVMAWIADEVLKYYYQNRIANIDGLPVPLEILEQANILDKQFPDPTNTFYLDAVLRAFKESRWPSLALIGMITGKPFEILNGKHNAERRLARIREEHMRSVGGILVSAQFAGMLELAGSGSLLDATAQYIENLRGTLELEHEGMFSELSHEIEEEIEFSISAELELALEIYAMITGKPVDIDNKSIMHGTLAGYGGGHPFRTEATGRSQALLTQYYLSTGRVRGLPTLNGAAVSIQGFGNVGMYNSLEAHKQGARFIGVSDHSGALVWDGEKGRLPIDEMVDWFNTQYAKTGRLPTLEQWHNTNYTSCSEIRFLPGAKNSKHVLYMDVDVLFLDALEDQINDSNVSLVSPRVKVISEGANAPVAPDAEEVLNSRGITVLTDFLFNAGGVAGSEVEWWFNMTLKPETLSEPDSAEHVRQEGLKMVVDNIMKPALDDVLNYQDSYYNHTGHVMSLRMAARIVAIQKILNPENISQMAGLSGKVATDISKTIQPVGRPAVWQARELTPLVTLLENRQGYMRQLSLAANEALLTAA